MLAAGSHPSGTTESGNGRLKAPVSMIWEWVEIPLNGCGGSQCSEAHNLVPYLNILEVFIYEYFRSVSKQRVEVGLNATKGSAEQSGANFVQLSTSLSK
jgi:hypothetical protein